ncbi:probable blue pigment (indigoidine) exporter [Micromonospora siamensis]|uniref:Probable blue pigment (Indigoidine) exporter n=1 Tax=Micromonospora siamensis TaxID=299152 RepID=A0A1C5K4G0_9ACTN|nr:probable blue pigment (indigoidine) exporter [Micromonospora siamensis]
MSRRAADVALTALAPATWGTTYLVTSELLPPDRPLWSGVIRALPAGLLLLALTRHRPHGSWWWRSAVLGALNIGAFFPLLFLAAYRLPGGTAAVLGAAQPLLVAGLAVLVLRDRPHPRAVLAATAAPLGVALVVLRPDAGTDPIGVAAGLVATAAMATGLVLTRRWGRPPRAGGLAATSWQLTAGGLLIVPVAVAVEGPPPAPDGPALLGYAWLGLAGTALAYALWFRGAARLPLTQVSVLGALSPLTAAALGWLVLGQALTPAQLGGFALAVAAMIAAQLPAGTGRAARIQRAGRLRWAARLRWAERGGRIGSSQPAKRQSASPPPAAASSAPPAVPPASTVVGRVPGGNSAAAASGRVNRCAAAGPAA